MKIDHIAIWADDIEVVRAFYMKYFGMTSGAKYTNQTKHFTSYFLSFADAGTRIEIMNVPDMADATTHAAMRGLAHFAIGVGSKQAVDELTERLRADGYAVLSGPRTTGDGCYESCVADPEGNRVEITE